MSIDYKNDKGLNERKANQSATQIERERLPKELKEERFEINDQDPVEQKAGEQGVTSGESFDKYAQKPKETKMSQDKNQRDYESHTKRDDYQNDPQNVKNYSEERQNLKDESDSTYAQKQALKDASRKDQIDKRQDFKPRDNA